MIGPAGGLLRRQPASGAGWCIKAGAVIGGDGFGYLSGARGPRAGSRTSAACILEDDVEIGSNSCVDRGSLDDTVIGAGTKLDNLVHVGHNVRIGRALPAHGGRGHRGEHADRATT